MYFRSKNTVPQEFFKLVVSRELAPGFNFEILDDFSKKHKGPPMFLKKSVEKSEKFFLEIIEKHVSYVFLSTLAGVPPFFSRGPPIVSPLLNYEGSF